MCTVGDGDLDGETLIPIENSISESEKLCRKCSGQSCVLLRKKDAYCSDCFMDSATHKFRAAIGKSKLVKPKDKMLVAYSGSQSCTALLHCLKSGFNEKCHKKFLFGVVCCYIDESAILNTDLFDVEKTNESIRNNVNKFEFPFYSVKLSESLCEAPKITENGFSSGDMNHETKLNNLFSDVSCMTSKEDLLLRLRHNLLINVAKLLNCTKIFMAETGMDLAVRILTNVTLGRGYQLPLDVGFCDNRDKTVQILRPMRDFSNKEIIFYNYINKLEAVTIPSLTTMAPNDVSISKLTESFITNLHEEFPSTMYTIFSTGNKLSTGEENSGSLSTCLLCKGYVKKQNSDYDVTKALQVSINVSSCTGNSGKTECCGKGNCSSVTKGQLSKDDLEKDLCYGCRLIINDMETIENFPEEFLVAAKEKIDFESMREQISEFLLDDTL